MARKQVDWEAVELRYRGGTESLRSIAADFEITEGAIRQRAKKEEWTRDLSARVKLATDAAVLRKAATHNVRTEREAVAVEAEMRSTVVLRHRADLRRAIGITGTMLTELEAECAKDAKQREALAKRASVAKTLAEALRIQITLERQAFGLVGEEGEQPEHIVNAAAAAAAGAAAATSSKTFTMAERAVRLARLLAAQKPAEAEESPA